MEEILRTITINIERDPSISGYGGWDEWTLENMSSKETDGLLNKIEKACESYRKQCWTGVN